MLPIANVISAEKFVKKAQQVHGAQYDYHMVLNRESLSKHSPNYLNIDAPVFIRCLYHGEYIESPRHHLEGRGCPHCYADKNVDAIVAALYEHKVTAERDFFFPHVNWRYNFDLYLPDFNTIIQFHSLEHTEPLLEQGGVDHLRLIKETVVMRDGLARQMRVPIIYITTRHLRMMNREQLGNYIMHILNVHKYGPGYKQDQRSTPEGLIPCDGRVLEKKQYPGLHDWIFNQIPAVPEVFPQIYNSADRLLG